MDDIILSQIPLAELITTIRQVIKEEIATASGGMQNNDQPEKPITTQELCEYLRVSEPTISRWKKKRKIPFFNIGNSVRFNLGEVLKALGKHQK